MKKTLVWLLSWLMVPCLLPAQGRASMEPPVIKRTRTTVSFSARFSAFSPGESYRLGLGVNSADISMAEITLEKDGTPINVTMSNFKQGYTSSWWGVEELSVRGFVLDGAEVPGQGQSVVFKVTIPRSAADKAGALYVFVAKKYGPETWYLEDGAELTRQHW